MPLFASTKRPFASLSEAEVLALAIGAEEEDGRIYRDIAHRLKATFPASAEVFEAMAEEEDGHRRALLTLYRLKFGEHIPLVRREDVAGFSRPEALWLAPELNPEALWTLAEQMEVQAGNFYTLAASRSQDVAVRKLLGDLAAAERNHEARAEKLQATVLTDNAKHAETAAARQNLVLQVVQPGLAGLIDGSVSTLAPLFAAAMATQSSHETLLVGLAASVGAGISMGLTEGLSDDGKISGRGSPWLRGGVCGLATTLGGVGHALPYLLADVQTATALALLVVVIELAAIAYIRWHYMKSPLLPTLFQVVLGGALVVLVGLVLGGS
ncbi:MAG: rubrerythrin [Alphaproteobacteria bacterium]|jgi:rubrerythrin|nr:rubrerythrin [Alphaproteobacteria bacterium]